jgi:hypothetical protein
MLISYAGPLALGKPLQSNAGPTVNKVSGSDLTEDNALLRFEEAAQSKTPVPSLSGRGILITAGGPFVPSAYVAVRLLRRLGATLPIEIWHAGDDEIPPWARRAFEPCGVSLHDVMPYSEGRPLSEMRGWPIKPAALIHSTLRDVLFLDADCFPLRNPEFLFDSVQFREHRALFWPDNRSHRMVDGAPIWRHTGMPFRADPEFETGIFLIDKHDCWEELCLAQWMNANSSFWYRYVLGDKDTFYLAWRKRERSYFMAPACKRYGAVVTRHYWADGKPIADHRTGASKYSLPQRWGPFAVHLAPYQWRGTAKNVYDECVQRFFVKDFSLHVRLLDELKEYLVRQG